MLVRDSVFQEAVHWIESQPVVAVDVETTGLNCWRGDRIVGIAVSDAETSYYFPFRHGDGFNLPKDWIRRVVSALERVPKLVMFNAKFDLQFLLHDGMTMPIEAERCEDVMLAAHLMNENEESFQLKRLADKYLGPGSSMDEAELTRVLKQRYGQKATKGDLWRLRSDEVAAYACSDTLLTYRLWQMYLPHLENWKLTKLYMEVNRYSLILNQMEIRGFLLDVPRIEQSQAEIGPRLESIQHEIDTLAGYPLNPRSPKQVCEYFGIESSSAEMLSMINDPLAARIIEYRHWAKANRTYYQAYLDRMGPDHVIHPSFQVNGTVAGRLSCREPNLQNVPRQGKYFQVRDVFIARPGHRLLEVDYEQAEMRIAAHYSRDKRMTAIINEGRDPHGETAEALNIDRTDAKAMNFGVLYGMGVSGFARNTGKSYEEAKAYLDAYHALYTGFRRLSNYMADLAQRQGYIRLETGRVRRYNPPEIEYRTAMNNLIQGTAAELIRISMMRLWEQVPEAHMLIQVHDSLIFEVPDDVDLSRTYEAIREIMEGFNFNPRMQIDAKVGSRWGSLEGMTVAV